ncbi:unnamed protein product [Phytophthora fragariaefolia]|uniref:Unnamed protein product n=1 Tax=Phytophthora fragariaefolia TaxID=1490495 RepID=A0A9W6UBC8_9STRA|nr:unnamed protein product [Phytophthora fragariaefolia]
MVSSTSEGRLGKSMTKGDVIEVEWNNEERVFTVFSDESMVAHFSSPERLPEALSFVDDVRQTQTTDHDLANLIDHFTDCLNLCDASVLMAEIQTFRTRALKKILNTPTPLRWLPSFLAQWQNVLEESKGATLTPSSRAEYCHELVGIASGWKVIGDIVRARSALGKCFHVVKRYLKTPARTLLPEGDENQPLQYAAISAKKLLLDCVAYQTCLVHQKELFMRHDAPYPVLAALTKAFWMLFCQAPFSVTVATLLTHSLMKQRQFNLVIRFLGQSALTGENTELTLVHAQALAYMGFYTQSLRIAELFIEQVAERKDGTVTIEYLRVYCSRMRELLSQRERADELLRQEQFTSATSAYDACLRLVDTTNHKLTAALLFGHANALMGLQQLRPAICDLRKSIQLDPANKLAALRLQTASLQLETERIRSQLS